MLHHKQYYVRQNSKVQKKILLLFHRLISTILDSFLVREWRKMLILYLNVDIYRRDAAMN